MSQTKSPLKDKPLRYVAQSGDEAIEFLVYDKLVWFYTVVVVIGTVICFEWLRYLHPQVTPPVLITVLGGIICATLAWRFIVHYRKLKAMKLGRNGERAVGQYLETFRELGCHVYHDILGDNFNVDHVIISTKGIFVIETKTYSKPISGRTEIFYDGQKILINGREPFKDILTQVQAASSYIKMIINDSTGKNFQTFPVVLFPGWYITGDGNKKGRMWVLEPRAFKKFVENGQEKMTDDDMRLASYHLSRHIRTM